MKVRAWFREGRVRVSCGGNAEFLVSLAEKGGREGRVTFRKDREGRQVLVSKE